MNGFSHKGATDCQENAISLSFLTFLAGNGV